VQHIKPDHVTKRTKNSHTYLLMFCIIGYFAVYRFFCTVFFASRFANYAFAVSQNTHALVLQAIVNYFLAFEYIRMLVLTSKPLTVIKISFKSSITKCYHRFLLEHKQHTENNEI